MPSHDYRVRVSKRGSTDLGSTNVAFTVSTTGGSTSGFIRGLDAWGGQEIRPTDGKVVSRPWKVTLGESQADEEITGRLMDGGRAAILRRLLDLSVRPTTATAWTSTHVDATGRITDVAMADDVGAYEFTVQNERVVEREATIFTDAVVDPLDPDPTDVSKTSIIAGSTTASLYPAGFRTRWNTFRPSPTATYLVSLLTLDNLVHLRKVAEPDDRKRLSMTQAGEQLILDDLYGERRGLTVDGMPNRPLIPDSTSLEGDFRTLVAEVDGTIRALRAPGLIRDGKIHRAVNEDEETDKRVPHEMWVCWPSSEQPSLRDRVQVRLVAPTHEPTPALPKHIASGTSDAPGEHVVEVATDIWDEIGVRYASTQTSAMVSRRESRRGSFVVTRANQKASRWMEERLWRHSLIAPVVDGQGRVAPKSIALPTPDDISSVGALKTAGSSNLATHPTWTHASNEIINVLNVEAKAFNRFRVDAQVVPGFVRDDVEHLIEEFETAESTNAKFLGRHAIDVKLPAFSDQQTLDFVKTQFFTRYGDGPVRSEVEGLEDLEGQEVGEFVVVNLDTFPNLGAESRGGQRIMQITSRWGTKRGPRYHLVDAGTTASKLSTPSISVSRNSATPRHSIDVDVGTTGTGYVLQHAESDSEPGTGSSLWDPSGGNASGGSTYTVQQLAAGQKHWFRAQARAPGRIGSTWTSPASTTTQKLDAVSSFSSSGVTACSADLSVVPSMSDYPVEVTRDSTRQVVLGPASSGSTMLYSAVGLESGSTYSYVARHVDGFGGASTDTPLTVNTTTAADTAQPVDFSFATALGTT